MKRLTWPWWVALVLLTLLFLVLRLPASILGMVVAAQTDGKLQLAASQGSLWQGSAQPILQDAALAERLEWAWQPAGLLRGKLGYAIKLDGGQALLSFGLGGLELREADLTFAAGPLLRLDARTRAYGLTGQLRVASPELHWKDGKPVGQLSVDWLGATSTLVPSLNPLGDYRATLVPAGDGWRLQLATLAGVLQLNGGGDWQAKQGLRGEVSLKAAPGAEAQLAPFLGQIGPGGPDAARTIKFGD
ncbi:type II secretion system protein N [Chitinimonas arctica]|uniref:Type II secretion system protein N n=1 Tax=Chitinimonas arctica TaxID=2594795 RepID=A0A516SD08_9NEIS|nr:type II secretion system protein N [Chitinimonas arctica]QDQ26020.1 type II secretion system protein N [Chitinimonas arctica]